MNRKEQIEQAAIDVYGTAYCRAAEHFVAGAMWSDANPGLKESEDERIKREILELVSIACNGNQFEEWKDWLEKQGEQKPNPYSGTSFEYNGHIWGMCARDNGVDILLDKQLFKHLEKQGEQKTLDADKVIEWLKTKVYDDSTYGRAMIGQFKKDFGL